MKQDLSNIKAVVFDVDGTLYKGGIAAALISGDLANAQLARCERKARKKMKRRDYGTGKFFYNVFFRYMRRLTGKPSESLRSWYFKTYMPLMARVITENKSAQKRTNELLMAIRERGMRIAVYSDYTMALEKLGGLDINTSLVDRFYCAEEMGALKPQPRPFKEICRDLGVKPEEALMIGDRPDTDGGAVEVGMKFICLEGKRTKKLDRESVSYDIMSWEELCDLLIK